MHSFEIEKFDTAQGGESSAVLAQGAIEVPEEDQTLLAEKSRNQALWNGEAGGQLKQLTSNREEAVLAFVRARKGDAILVIGHRGAPLSAQHRQHAAADWPALRPGRAPS